MTVELINGSRSGGYAGVRPDTDSGLSRLRLASSPGDHARPTQLLICTVPVYGYMTQTTLDGTDLSELRSEYDQKVHHRLPELAQNGDGWPIHLDHCFGRVVLDTLFQDEWYDHVNGRPAYKHLSEQELTDAIDIADQIIDDGAQMAAELNDRSLQWRDATDG